MSLYNFHMAFALFLIATANFLSFGWSVIGVFKKTKDQNMFKYRVLQVASIGTWILCSYGCYQTEAPTFQIITCMAIQVFCLIAFWKTSTIVKRHQFTIAFSNDKPNVLVKEGLYRKVRHPFYSIYLISYFSVGLLLLDVPAIIASFVMLAVYFEAARTEEQKFMKSELADQYQEYRKKTHMFAPKISA